MEVVVLVAGSLYLVGLSLTMINGLEWVATKILLLVIEAVEDEDDRRLDEDVDDCDSVVLTKEVKLTEIVTDVLLFEASKVGEVAGKPRALLELVSELLDLTSVLVTLTVSVKVVVGSEELCFASGSLTTLMTRVEVALVEMLPEERDVLWSGAAARLVSVFKLALGLREFGYDEGTEGVVITT
jgi:hypothetical protein